MANMMIVTTRRLKGDVVTLYNVPFALRERITEAGGVMVESTSGLGTGYRMPVEFQRKTAEEWKTEMIQKFRTIMAPPQFTGASTSDTAGPAPLDDRANQDGGNGNDPMVAEPTEDGEIQPKHAQILQALKREVVRRLEIRAQVTAEFRRVSAQVQELRARNQNVSADLLRQMNQVHAKVSPYLTTSLFHTSTAELSQFIQNDLSGVLTRISNALRDRIPTYAFELVLSSTTGFATYFCKFEASDLRFPGNVLYYDAQQLAKLAQQEDFVSVPFGNQLVIVSDENDGQHLGCIPIYTAPPSSGGGSGRNQNRQRSQPQHIDVAMNPELMQEVHQLEDQVRELPCHYAITVAKISGPRYIVRYWYNHWDAMPISMHHLETTVSPST